MVAKDGNGYTKIKKNVFWDQNACLLIARFIGSEEMYVSGWDFKSHDTANVKWRFSSFHQRRKISGVLRAFLTKRRMMKSWRGDQI